MAFLDFLFSLRNLIGNIILFAALAALIVYLGVTYLRSRQRRAMVHRQALATQAQHRRAQAEKAARERAMQQYVAEVMQAEAQQSALRAEAQRRATERMAAERMAAEQAMQQWVDALEIDMRRQQLVEAEQTQREAEETERKRQAAEQAIAEWLAQMQIDEKDSTAATIRTLRASRPHSSKVDAVREAVMALMEHVESESDKVAFMSYTIATKVDFLPFEIKYTLEKWKTGKIHRSSMLPELKLKFRYEAYSIEDGREAYYAYLDWIEKVYLKLPVFLRLLGTEARKDETITATIKRAETAEWNKQLNMDMDVLFTLKLMRNILPKLEEMKLRLADLEIACRKRAEQVIAPPWEPHDERW